MAQQNHNTPAAAAAASSLADPPSRGTLSYAYRRSVVALGNVFGFQPSSSHPPGTLRSAERQPLLAGHGGHDEDEDGDGEDDGYGATNQQGQRQTPGTQGWEARIRKPKQVLSPVRVEAKVWFANERTWIAWLRVSLLIGSFALAMLNSASFFSHRTPGNSGPPVPPPGNGGDGPPGEPGVELPPPAYSNADARFIRIFGGVYAVIAVLTLLWGLLNYQRRVTLIKRKYGGPLDDLVGPPVICAALFVAVLLNFIFKVKEHQALVEQP